MEKMTWKEAKSRLREFNKTHGITTKDPDQPLMVMAVVFKPESFNMEYTLEGRTYLTSNLNKAFLPDMGGYSIFANCLDGTDPGVRLEQYISEEGGRFGRWVVDYCYIRCIEMPGEEETA